MRLSMLAFLLLASTRCSAAEFVEVLEPVSAIVSQAKVLRLAWPQDQARFEELSKLSDEELLVAGWRAGLKELGLEEQTRFFEGSAAASVIFEGLAGRLGTFDRGRNACLFNRNLFAEFLAGLRASGLGREEAVRVLAAKSLPTFAHVVRDGLMSAERKALGLDYDGGLIEDEILHWWEMALIYKKVAERRPGLYGGEPRTYFDDEAEGLFDDLKRGPEAVAERVRGLYALPSILRMPRQDLIARYERPLQDLESDLGTYRKHQAIRLSVPMKYWLRPYDPPPPTPFRKAPPSPDEQYLEEYFWQVKTHKRRPADWKDPAEAAGALRIWVWVPADKAARWEREASVYRSRLAVLKDDAKYQDFQKYFRDRLKAIGIPDP